jgi:2'-5' RNA ligase
VSPARSPQIFFMASPETTIPGYRFYEYLVVIAPHEELREKIQNAKNEFAEKYKLPALKGRSHITLVKFHTWQMMEEKLVQRLKVVAMGTTPFKVELKGFGSFPSHTIFINVATKLPVQDLVKELKQAQRLMKANPENTPHFMTEPFISIAQKLKPWQYEQGWLEYSHRNFTGRFIADSMMLLKRPAGEKGFQIVQRFEFQNLPVTTKQGALFG